MKRDVNAMLWTAVFVVATGCTAKSAAGRSIGTDATQVVDVLIDGDAEQTSETSADTHVLPEVLAPDATAIVDTAFSPKEPCVRKCQASGSAQPKCTTTGECGETGWRSDLACDLEVSFAVAVTEVSAGIEVIATTAGTGGLPPSPGCRWILGNDGTALSASKTPWPAAWATSNSDGSLLTVDSLMADFISKKKAVSNLCRLGNDEASSWCLDMKGTGSSGPFIVAMADAGPAGTYWIHESYDSGSQWESGDRTMWMAHADTTGKITDNTKLAACTCEGCLDGDSKITNRPAMPRPQLVVSPDGLEAIAVCDLGESTVVERCTASTDGLNCAPTQTVAMGDPLIVRAQAGWLLAGQLSWYPHLDGPKLPEPKTVFGFAPGWTANAATAEWGTEWKLIATAAAPVGDEIWLVGEMRREMQYGTKSFYVGDVIASGGWLFAFSSSGKPLWDRPLGALLSWGAYEKAPLDSVFHPEALVGVTSGGAVLGGYTLTPDGQTWGATVLRLNAAGGMGAPGALDACAGKRVSIDCGDGNPCTVDSCDPQKGCVNRPVGGKNLVCSNSGKKCAGTKCS